MHVDSSNSTCVVLPYDSTAYPYYLYISVINLSCDHNYILCSRSLKSKYLNVGWPWGPLEQPLHEAL